MNQQLYKKVGRKYIPIGYSDGFTGFPAEGIWIVYSKPGIKSETCIAQVGKFEPINYIKLANLIAKKEYSCLEAVNILLNKGNYNSRDLVNTIFKTLVEHEKT